MKKGEFLEGKNRAAGPVPQRWGAGAGGKGGIRGDGQRWGEKECLCGHPYSEGLML